MEQEWYTSQINVICAWLTERADCSLHHVQLSALSQIVRVCVCYFSLLLLPLSTSLVPLILSRCLFSSCDKEKCSSLLHSFSVVSFPLFPHSSFLPSFTLIGLTSDDVNFLSHSACSFDYRRYIFSLYRLALSITEGILRFLTTRI